MDTLTPTLHVQQGGDFTYDFLALDDQGRPRVLTGWSAHARVSAMPSGRAVLEPRVRLTTGRATLAIPAGDTGMLNFPLGSYDVALHGPRGQRELLAAGRVLVRRLPR